MKFNKNLNINKTSIFPSLNFRVNRLCLNSLNISYSKSSARVLKVINQVACLILLSNSAVVHGSDHVVVVHFTLLVQDLLGGSSSPPVPVHVCDAEGKSDCQVAERPNRKCLFCTDSSEQLHKDTNTKSVSESIRVLVISVYLWLFLRHYYSI